jgi:aminocarboxymuconate-semialdehyde decarboxylase
MDAHCGVASLPATHSRGSSDMTVIDTHTHMVPREWLDLLQAEGGDYELKPTPAGHMAVHLAGAPFVTLMPEMFDYDMRLRAMDEAGVDIAVLSLTGPNVFWGTPEVSAKAARIGNAAYAASQSKYPDRIRWVASIPWETPDAALAELARARADGALGVAALANIRGRDLSDPLFEPVWSEIDRLGLPVFVHPTIPPGGKEMRLGEFSLATPIGFMVDTTLAFARLILSGFFDRYPNAKLIAPHGGGTLPYLSGRLDRCYETIPACRAAIKEPPSRYLRRIFYDTVVYDPRALELCVAVGGADNVLYGTDFPHNVGDMKGILALVRGLQGDTPHKVAGENAKRIFNIQL